MATRTLELEVGRNPEMGVDGRPTRSDNSAAPSHAI